VVMRGGVGWGGGGGGGGGGGSHTVQTRVVCGTVCEHGPGGAPSERPHIGSIGGKGGQGRPTPSAHKKSQEIASGTRAPPKPFLSAWNSFCCARSLCGRARVGWGEVHLVHRTACASERATSYRGGMHARVTRARRDSSPVGTHGRGARVVGPREIVHEAHRPGCSHKTCSWGGTPADTQILPAKLVKAHRRMRAVGADGCTPAPLFLHKRSAGGGITLKWMDQPRWWACVRRVVTVLRAPDR
jgi:hypothetical protein